jgi:hypothetical protein
MIAGQARARAAMCTPAAAVRASSCSPHPPLTRPGDNAAMLDPGDVFLRLALDAVVIAALVYGIYLPRHRRMDLVVVYGLFNLGLFLALVVIAGGGVSMGVGFGLFAVLSIVRLRSEPFSNRELAYFFVALVLALVCAIDLGGLVIAGALACVALLAAWVIDHPRFSRPTRQTVVMLEEVFAEPGALRRHLEQRLNVQVTDVATLELDYVRETTRVAVTYRAQPGAHPVPEEALHAAVAVAGR